MKLHRWQKNLAVLVLLVGAGAFATWLVLREPPPDTRFNGAYELEDGRRVYITPREGEVLRYRLEDGTSGALYPEGELRYVSGPGWSGREPVELEVTFRMDAGGRPEGFTWRRPTEEGTQDGTEEAGAAQEARRLDLPEELFTLPSGELALRAKLVLPPGPGPHPAAVLVHGSGSESAVDHYFMPYLFAAHGVATLVYDKRGTGGSEGEYTQNFHVLARDVAAAVEALRARPDIDPERIHLQGASQGGWIAPLAASHIDGIRSLLIGYGPMMPIIDEDRWGYVYELRRQGFGEEAIARADEIHETVGAILDHGEWERWDALGRLLDEAEGEPWFEAAAGSDSTVGFLAETWMPGWVMKLYARWRLRPVDGEPFADRLYDPVPVVAALDVPSLWIFGGEDSSMPTGWSVAELERLQAAGRPIEILVYPEAEHGILRFEEGEDGERRYLGYEPEYLMTMVRWLRAQSGLELVGSPQPGTAGPQPAPLAPSTAWVGGGASL